jgi:putative nucleotidyltransferase with HDIG domain
MNNAELVTWFQRKYPNLVKAMKECSHHGNNLNAFHLEDDVFTHSMMVLNQLPDTSCNKIVRIAALLHDIGKPLAKKVTDKGQVRFLSHESIGAFLSLTLTKDPELGLDNKERLQIFKLICLHTEPYKLTIDQLNELLTDEMAISLMLRDLFIADNKGRFTSIKGEVKGFTWNYLNSGTKVFNKEFILLVGLPTSGKSTYAFELQKQGYTVISRDNIITSMHPDKTYNQAYKLANKASVNNELSKLLKKHRNTEKVVIDMTNLTKSGRRKFINQFPEHKKKCVVFLTDIITLIERNNSRDGKVISSEVIHNMAKSFYLPTYSEFEDIEWRLT